jgi:hypothetical protein
VQTILIPLTVAGFQMLNLRGILSQANGAWNYLCGAAIFFGTYFLWVLGPKSLAAEGQALWIALTWPRGLESLLKAKAWLWSLISSGMVFLVLAWAAFLFPAQIPQIALVGVGWWFFGRSMAEKSVTLVTIASSSGEPQPLPRGRRPARHAHVRSRRGHSPVEPRHRGHRVFVDNRRRHVAELPRASALPL